MTGDQLIMELTGEQGPGRETQVQPPLGVWAWYFGFNLANPPEITLTNMRAAAPQPEVRPVVEHDHNWTVEIADAAPPRPAILRFRRTGPTEFEYWVYRPQDDEYDHCSWFLNNFPNPHWTKGRRWLVI